MRFIYRGRIAVFSIKVRTHSSVGNFIHKKQQFNLKVLRDERICVVAEQRPDCSEEESFQVRRLTIGLLLVHTSNKVL